MKTKKATPYLDFYKKCMDTGYMPNKGLCYSLPLKWQRYELYDLFDEGLWYWGYSGVMGEYPSFPNQEWKYEFTPLRQTIVLFMAAMNNEL